MDHPLRKNSVVTKIFPPTGKFSDPNEVCIRNHGMQNVVGIERSIVSLPFFGHDRGVGPSIGGIPLPHFFGSREVDARIMTNDPEHPTSMTNPNTLLDEVARTADRRAFRSLFDHFAPRLKSYIHGQRTDPQMAEEIVQETMVKVWQKAHQFDPTKASAATWIFSIARNSRIDILRRANRPEPDFNDPAFVSEPVPLATDTLQKAQEADILNQLVNGLPADQKDVLKLAYFEDKPHPKIAEALNIPLGTVKSRIRLALKRIRAELGDQR